MKNTNKSVNNFQFQIENLDRSIVDYFNTTSPIFIKGIDNNEKKVDVILNMGETWEQIQNFENRQARADFILQKPIITIKGTDIKPIKEWNRLKQLKILVDKQLKIRKETGEPEFIPKKKSVPVFEYTYISPPTYFKRFYRLTAWAE